MQRAEELGRLLVAIVLGVVERRLAFDVVRMDQVCTQLVQPAEDVGVPHDGRAVGGDLPVQAHRGQLDATLDEHIHDLDEAGLARAVDGRDTLAERGLVDDVHGQVLPEQVVDDARVALAGGKVEQRDSPRKAERQIGIVLLVQLLEHA